MRQRYRDNRGVSPVIAVILMVAITVILASVVGVYALNIGNEVRKSPPNAVFEFEQEYGPYDDSATGGGNPLDDKYYKVNIIYKAGPQLNLNNINITMDAGSEPWERGTALWFDPYESHRGGLNLPFRDDSEIGSKDHIEPGEESGPLMATYDPDHPKRHYNNPYPATMKEMVTQDRVEEYSFQKQFDSIYNDWVSPHTAAKLATPGTTIRVIWTGGSQKQVLAEYTVQEA